MKNTDPAWLPVIVTVIAFFGLLVGAAFWWEGNNPFTGMIVGVLVTWFVLTMTGVFD